MTVNVGKLAGEAVIGGGPGASVEAGLISPISAGLKTAPELWLPQSLERDADPTDFKTAMRSLAGGVVVITTGQGDDRTGFTATSVVSLSAEPPSLMFGISQASSSWEVLQKYRTFGVNILSESDAHVADRFAGQGGLKGIARFGQSDWATWQTGAPLLSDSAAAFDCEIDEVLLRYDHAIIIGRVKAVRSKPTGAPLVYWNGHYQTQRR